MAKKPNKATKAKRGRPTKYTPELAERICERLSGGEPLTRICAEAGMPDRT